MGRSVFISYARSVSAAHAQALADKLDDLAFLDTSVIDDGADFPAHLLHGLLDAKLLVIFAIQAYMDRRFCRLEMRVGLAASVGETPPLVLALGSGWSSVMDAMPETVARQSWLMIALVSFLGNLWGQDCNAILVHGLRNVTVSKSEDAAIAMKYYNHCGQNYSSMSDAQLASAEVSVFGYGSGSGSYARAQREERLNQWCIANKEFAQSHRSAYNEAQDIFAPAVAAWDSCNKLASNSVQIIPSITPDDRTVDIKLKYTGPSGEVKLQNISTENFTCTYATSNGNSVTLPATLGPSLINVNCRRGAPQSVTRGSTSYTKLERSTISVFTAGDSLQLYFPERWDPELPQVAAARMQDEIEALRAIVPTATIVAYAGKTAPQGWLLCDGSTISRTGENQRLFAILGETYGRGDERLHSSCQIYVVDFPVVWTTPAASARPAVYRNLRVASSSHKVTGREATFIGARHLGKTVPIPLNLGHSH